MTYYSASEAIPQQVFSDPMLGHNLPPFDLGAFIDRVVDAPLTASEKLIQIVLARLAQVNGGTVAPKRSDVLAKASCSEATFKRSFGLLRTFFEVEKRTGSTTRYSVKPVPTQDEVETAITTWKAPTKGHSDTTQKRSQAHSDTKKAGITVIPRSESTPLPDTTAKEKSPHTPLKENNIYNTPLTPRQAQQGVDRRDPFGLNPMRKAIHDDVWFDADDRLQVNNGFRVELETLAGGTDALRIELDRAAEWIGPNTPPQVLKTKVRGRVQTQVTERKDRDRRYEKAKQDNTRTPDGKPSADATVAKHKQLYRGVL